MGMVVDSGSAAQPVLGVFLMRKALLAGVAALLLGREAVAEPIIVIISSQHNLEYARRACSSVTNPEVASLGLRR
jgi:hypothetical protein